MLISMSPNQNGHHVGANAKPALGRRQTLRRTVARVPVDADPHPARNRAALDGRKDLVTGLPTRILGHYASWLAVREVRASHFKVPSPPLRCGGAVRRGPNLRSDRVRYCRHSGLCCWPLGPVMPRSL